MLVFWKGEGKMSYGILFWVGSLIFCFELFLYLYSLNLFVGSLVVWLVLGIGVFSNKYQDYK